MELRKGHSQNSKPRTRAEYYNLTQASDLTNIVTGNLKEEAMRP